MRSLQNILTGLRYPRRSLVELYSRLIRLAGGPDGIDVMAADWDNLVILDACRFDVFRDHCALEGDLQRVTSQGTHTGEFLEKNIQAGDFLNTVYVTAHPRPAEFDARFHEVYHVWDHE